MSDENDTPSNSFATILAQVGYGGVLEVCSEKLASLVQAVSENEKKGTFTLTLTVKPRGKDSGQVELSAEVVTKEPTRDLAPSMFFATEEGALLRDNPRQKKFGFADDKAERVKPAANDA